ncbi:MAG: hypothetical protein WCG75_10995 [Armatimonadota bacterium]
MNRISSSICCFGFAISQAVAQESNNAATNSPETIKTPQNVDLPIWPMTANEFWLTIAILIFGLIVLLIIQKSIPKDHGIDISRIYGAPIIIIAILVLISSGFSKDTTAPGLGLFGTIAGYILGRSSTEKKASSDYKDPGSA